MVHHLGSCKAVDVGVLLRLWSCAYMSTHKLLLAVKLDSVEIQRKTRSVWPCYTPRSGDRLQNRLSATLPLKQARL